MKYNTVVQTNTKYIYKLSIYDMRCGEFKKEFKKRVNELKSKL